MKQTSTVNRTTDAGNQVQNRCCKVPLILVIFYVTAIVLRLNGSWTPTGKIYRKPIARDRKPVKNRKYEQPPKISLFVLRDWAKTGILIRNC